jgi:hypothetical protein
MLTEYNLLGLEYTCWLVWHSNEPLDFIKGAEFLAQLNDFELL